MSPEQAMGKLDVDHRTDVFALAAIASEMATGKVAFDGANVAEILMKIVQQQPAPPSSLNPRYPHSFDDVVEAGVAKQKQNRIGSATELAARSIAAFGLTGDASTWAKGPISALEQALSTAKPPASVPFGGASASAMHQSEPPPALEVPMSSGLGKGAKISLVVAACVVLLGVVAALLR
jgi:serine/threonine-protein kinase